MREIKFRAWLIIEKKMIFSEKEPNRFHFGNGYMHIIQLDDELYFPRIVPMQYTGIKDKNNKEIYEGDLIKLHNDTYCYEVFYIGAGFEGRCKPIKGITAGSIGYSQFKHSEINGNIYENPELIEPSSPNGKNGADNTTHNTKTYNNL